MTVLLTHPSASGAQLDGSLRQLRFSPDGRYILAQSDYEVAVLAVQPFSILFRAPAKMSTDAEFTPDSRQILFVSGADSRWIMLANSTPRLERWSIADHTRADAREIPWRACGTGELSPDGWALACLGFDWTLHLVEADSTKTILERRNFGEGKEECWLGGETDITMRYYGHHALHRFVAVRPEPGSARVAFSSDGRFVVAVAEPAGAGSVAWDLRNGSAVALKRSLKLLTWETCPCELSPCSGQFFAFVGRDRLIISNLWWSSKGLTTAKLIAFPSGNLLSTPKLPPGPVFRATDPGFVLVRPFGEGTRPNDPTAQRAAAVELATGEVIISNTRALDVFGSYYVAEPSTGTVGLYERGKGLQATVPLHEK